jgi:hypothetical protein
VHWYALIRRRFANARRIAAFDVEAVRRELASLDYVGPLHERLIPILATCKSSADLAALVRAA